MSCDKCQNDPIIGAFYRWGTANIEIIACKEHWLEVREALNKAQNPDKGAMTSKLSFLIGKYYAKGLFDKYPNNFNEMMPKLVDDLLDEHKRSKIQSTS